jgi:hypothetical protein
MRRFMWGCRVVFLSGWAVLDAGLGGLAFASTVYKCPGPPMLYTDAISAKEAKAKSCTPLDAAPVTVIATPPRRVIPTSGGSRIDVGEQRARDSDSKQILMTELKKEEQLLSSLRSTYNNGEPERQGDEKNYQRYLDRVAEMKAEMVRKESDIAALKREIAKLP